MPRKVIPLSKRKLDIVFIVFFIINIFFVTYIIDFEQIAIPNPYDFEYPIWPPKIFVQVIHWWEFNFDPVILKRHPWWMTTIWFDFLLFGPYYFAAVYAFIKGKNWIRIPSIIYASCIFTIVVTILSEEIFGEDAGPNVPLVVAVNLPWLFTPLALLLKMVLQPHPFTEPRKRGYEKLD